MKTILFCAVLSFAAAFHAEIAKAEAKTVDVSIDFEFNHYDDCLVKLGKVMKVSTLSTTDSSGQLTRIDRAETYCRGIFPDLSSK